MSNPYILVASGNRIDLLDPCPSTILPSDIVQGLHGQFRFNGQSRKKISVLSHSYYTLRLLDDLFIARAIQRPPAVLRLSNLIHDAHEAYMGDILGPICNLPELKAPISALKFRLQTAIHARFGLPAVLSTEHEKLIQFVDCQALQNEMQHHMPEMVFYGEEYRAKRPPYLANEMDPETFVRIVNNLVGAMALESSE